ncbi:hypothetical protein ABMX48_37415 [Streptomyces cavourensis]
MLMAEVPETDTRPDRTRNGLRLDRLVRATTLAVEILGLVMLVVMPGNPATTTPGPTSVTVVCAANAQDAHTSGDLS